MERGTAHESAFKGTLEEEFLESAKGAFPAPPYRKGTPQLESGARARFARVSPKQTNPLCGAMERGTAHESAFKGTLEEHR